MPFHHPQLKPFELVPPGPTTIGILELRRFRRNIPLSHLVKPAEDRCAWCNVGSVTKRRKYCDENCSESAYITCYPQSPQAKMYAFIHLQDCVCPICGEWFEDQIKERIDKEWAWIEKNRGLYSWCKDEKWVSLWNIGNGTGEIWQVDHIIPIFRGGPGVGFDNIQVVCKGCHLEKTRRER